MGAWDFSVFDDDSACDALDELKEAEDIISLMEEYFERAFEGDYLEYDDGCCILAAAAVMDSVLNGTVYSCYDDDEECADWIKSLKQLDFSPLKDKAVRAVEAVMAENSELRELWGENEELYGKWLEEKAAICKRLQ